MGQENGWGWYAQAMWQHAFNARDGYRPGDSFDINGGVHYDGLLNSLGIVPVIQLRGRSVGIDSGENRTRIIQDMEDCISPGIEVVATNHLRLYADLRIPLVTHVRGDQLVAPAL